MTRADTRNPVQKPRPAALTRPMALQGYSLASTSKRSPGAASLTATGTAQRREIKTRARIKAFSTG